MSTLIFFVPFTFKYILCRKSVCVKLINLCLCTFSVFFLPSPSDLLLLKVSLWYANVLMPVHIFALSVFSSLMRAYPCTRIHSRLRALICPHIVALCRPVYRFSSIQSSYKNQRRLKFHTPVCFHGSKWPVFFSPIETTTHAQKLHFALQKPVFFMKDHHSCSADLVLKNQHENPNGKFNMRTQIQKCVALVQSGPGKPGADFSVEINTICALKPELCFAKIYTEIQTGYTHHADMLPLSNRSKASHEQMQVFRVAW